MSESPEEMVDRPQIGVITQGSLTEGVEMKLNPERSVEDVKAGKFVVIEGFKNVAAGADPMALKRGMEKAAANLRDSIKAAATQVEGKDQISQVAALSAHEQEIGDLIAEVMEKVGKDGVITVEESKGLEY